MEEPIELAWLNLEELENSQPGQPIIVRIPNINLETLARVIAALTQHNDDIVAIDLSDNSYDLQPEDLELLATCLHDCKNVEQIIFDNNNLDVFAQYLINVLPALPKLETLSFDDTNTPIKIFECLKYCRNLTSISLANNNLLEIDRLNQMVDSLKKCPRLKEINMRCNSFGSYNEEKPDAEVLQLIAILLNTLPDLRAVDLGNNNLTDQDVQSFGSYINELKNLRVINLEDNKFSSQGLQILIRNIWSKTQNLEVVNIGGYTIGSSIKDIYELWFVLSKVLTKTNIISLTLQQYNAYGNPMIEYCLNNLHKFIQLNMQNNKAELQELRKYQAALSTFIMAMRRIPIILPTELWQYIFTFMYTKKESISESNIVQLIKIPEDIATFSELHLLLHYALYLSQQSNGQQLLPNANM